MIFTCGGEEALAWIYTCPSYPFVLLFFFFSPVFSVGDPPRFFALSVSYTLMLVSFESRFYALSLASLDLSLSTAAIIISLESV